MKQDIHTRRPSENAETRALVDGAFEMARSLGIQTLLVQADEARDVRYVNKRREGERLMWLTRDEADVPEDGLTRDHQVVVPQTQLTRMDQVMFGLFMTVLHKVVDFEERVICLSGIAGSKRLDTLVIACPERDFAGLEKAGIEHARKVIAPRVFVQVVSIALRFGAESREGKPIGTVFVIGSRRQLAKRVRQLVANPMRGHPAQRRSVFAPDFVESLRQFSALDGAFIVNKKGVVEAAGAYLDAPTSRLKLSQGLGARHAAAAAVTAVTDSVAVTLSESSGAVTVFHRGESILRFDNPACTLASPSRRGRRTKSKRRS